MKVLTILYDFEIQKSIVESLKEGGLNASDIIPCSYSDAGLFVEDPSIGAILIEVCKHDPKSSMGLIDQVKSVNQGAALIPFMHYKDPDVMLDLVKRSISDILIFPFDSGDISNLVKKLSGSFVSSSSFSAKPLQHARIIPVTSYKGGTGVSTIATNLAFCLAEAEGNSGKKVLLLDLANQSNHCAMFLNLDMTLNIHTVCKNLHKMESAYLTSICAWASNNLAVIGSDTGLEGVQPIEYNPLKQAFELLSESFHYIVIDLPTHSFDSRFLASAEASDQIVVVCSVDIGAIRDTKLYLQLLKELEIDSTKIRLLVNRYDSKSSFFSPKDLESALQQPISFFIPNDFQTLSQAIQEGQAVLENNPQSMLAESFADVAAGIESNSIFVPPTKDPKKPKASSFSLFNMKR